MNISDLISGGIGSSITSSVARMLNIDESKAKWVVSAAVPLMIAALNYNARNKNQGESIDRALDQHSGGIFDNLAGLLGGGATDDGNKIVGHIFGNNTGYVTQNLSEQSGLSAGQIGSVLSVLAPVVMGYLGQQKQSQSQGGGVADLIGGLLGGGGQQAGAGGLIGGLLSSVLGGGQQAEPAGNDGMGALADLAGEFFNQQNSQGQRGNVLDSLAGLFGR
ncbi:hypothetical protein GCM10023091_08840 [Ravibacter arvi]|uniref:DUF937 domain-containing protein n=1 Tax=Ravibacter arvi TaxID=2051041 RepID=A0ABP8LQY5_9BACT